MCYRTVDNVTEMWCFGFESEVYMWSPVKFFVVLLTDPVLSQNIICTRQMVWGYRHFNVINLIFRVIRRLSIISLIFRVIQRLFIINFVFLVIRRILIINLINRVIQRLCIINLVFLVIRRLVIINLINRVITKIMYHQPDLSTLHVLASSGVAFYPSNILLW